MLNKAPLFPGQRPEERIFLMVRKHWFNYFAFGFIITFFLAVVIVGSIFLAMYFPQLEVFYRVLGVVVISAFLLGIMALVLVGFINLYLDVYIITNERIVDISQDGLFRRSIAELHLLEVQDVSAKVDGFFRTVLHFGDVYIQTAGERENFAFYAIPNPYLIAKKIIDLHEQVIGNVRRGGGENIEKNRAVSMTAGASGENKSTDFCDDNSDKANVSSR